MRRAVLPLALLVLFAALVALRLHGFSISAWHAVIDGSAPAEVLLGEPRPIRSDDWKVQLPLAFAQAASEPRFSRSNERIGFGQSALLPIELPVADALVVFHPTLWGFFLGDDVGMSWLWWSRVLGLFAAWTGVFHVVTRGRLALSAISSAALCAAPFFQFWSFNAAPHAAAVGLAFVATVALARAERLAAIAASAVVLAWSGGCIAFALYPPYQVVNVWLYVALVAGYWLDAHGRDEGFAAGLRRHWLARAVALAAAGAVVLGSVAVFVRAAAPALESLRHTAYPGVRIATGGDRPLWQLLNENLAAPLWASDWGPFLNVCEAASFWMLAPIAIALWMWRYAADGQRFDRFALPIMAFWVVLIIYAGFDVPESVGRATLLSMVPGKRAVLAIGLADAVLLVRFLGCAAPAVGPERRRAYVLAVAWALAVAACAWRLKVDLPDARMAVLLGLAAVNGLLAAWVLAGRRRELPALALAAASLATTIWFNPLARGGADYVRGNELSRRILAIDREAGGESVWVAFGSDEIGDLLHAIGVRTLAGTRTLPPLELWERIDPEGKARHVYNRYAHVTFVAEPSNHPTFQLRSQDTVVLRINPVGRELRDLGATHAVFRGDARARGVFERMSPGYEYLGSVGDNHLYRLPPLPAAASALPDPLTR